ncbi:DUF5615 family PIN-like protein [Dyella sp. ASV21]|jgi:hypothetical protein|uniref:DUF5615 family PIN-like protein n=1 Tax=Dyella sp. ASV21 TaxID=2795114 RepID=UPI0018ED0122|nr:DUF5615 family PIN-like protein [Dyella sp. ASV21]
MWRDPEDLKENSAWSTAAPEQEVDGLRPQTTVCFYADEHFPPRAVELLRSVGAAVQTAAEANLLGQPAHAHAAHALQRGLALFTCDRDFLDDGQFPLPHSPAIFVFQFGEGTPSDIRRAFRCLAPVLAAAPLHTARCKVDAGRDCWTERFHQADGVKTRTRRLWHGRLQQWVA